MPSKTPDWVVQWFHAHGISIWGAADLHDMATPQDESGSGYPAAIAWATPMDPHIMAGIRNGPNQAYADEYARVNHEINRVASALAADLRARGHRALALAASERTDPITVRGDFPHKTAATRAGLGWIGRHCQLITRSFGSWVRLATVFTDLELACGPAVGRNYCGGCRRCVDACPAGALTGRAWRPGVAREEILDVQACDRWKKKHYAQYHGGHNCGICSAACPFGLRVLKRVAPQPPALMPGGA